MRRYVPGNVQSEDMFINGMRFGGDIVLTQRCWWGCILHSHDIWRRNVMRRYVLGDTQSED